MKTTDEVLANPPMAGPNLTMTFEAGTDMVFIYLCNVGTTAYDAGQLTVSTMVLR